MANFYHQPPDPTHNTHQIGCPLAALHVELELCQRGRFEAQVLGEPLHIDRRLDAKHVANRVAQACGSHCGHAHVAVELLFQPIALQGDNDENGGRIIN